MVLVDNQEQAEEVVQDAFANLYLKYRLVTTPLAYVRASVLNGSRKVFTSGECGAMFTYVVWHEITKTIGFGDVVEMQAMNPAIDFSAPPVEGVFDGVMLNDGGRRRGRWRTCINGWRATTARSCPARARPSSRPW